MNTEEQQPLDNASAIIERFGGIRPMAGKINVPVTTVQGWKKRDVIPGNRRDDIINAAQQNGIDISDLIDTSSIANQNDRATTAAASTPSYSSAAPQQPVSQAQASRPPRTEPGEDPFVRSRPLDRSHDELMAEIHSSSERAVKVSIWATTGLMLVVMAAGAVMMWPKAQQIDAQGSQLAALEGEVGDLGDEVRDVNRRASFLRDMVPEDMQAKLEKIQNQAQNLQATVSQISEQAAGIKDTVMSPDAGSMGERLAKLEEQVVLLTGSEEIGDMVSRVRALEATVAGQSQLSGAMAELQGIVDSLDGKVGGLEQKLAEAKTANADGALSQTLGDVSGDDLKAAAMLLAFSQLRDSLNRQAPFEEDLALLQKMVGDDNPELQTALTRLAPRANGGVLTPDGLSGEFKGLAGDIVVSSLKGEDVSVMEKAKARLGQVLQVEKDGDVITGTDTQAKVARAQAMLDKGDVSGALAELKTLEGEAASTAQPFVQEAEMTLLAQQVQGMMQNMILSKIGGLQMPSMATPAAAAAAAAAPMVAPTALPTTPPQGQVDLNAIKDNLQHMVPGQQEVIKDEESGLVILPRPQGFKGFSPGQQ